MVTANGKTYENGAVGFYLRDYNMPLDNMAVTTQIFLGTSMVCAQCHNHPFDKWTQMDYFQLAAHTTDPAGPRVAAERVDHGAAYATLGEGLKLDPAAVIKPVGCVHQADDAVLHQILRSSMNSRATRRNVAAR